MKRKKLIKHLKEHGCELDQHGSRHDHYRNTHTGAFATVPRHPDIKKYTAEAICKQLGIPVKSN